MSCERNLVIEILHRLTVFKYKWRHDDENVMNSALWKFHYTSPVKFPKKSVLWFLILTVDRMTLLLIYKTAMLGTRPTVLPSRDDAHVPAFLLPKC